MQGLSNNGTARCHNTQIPHVTNGSSCKICSQDYRVGWKAGVHTQSRESLHTKKQSSSYACRGLSFSPRTFCGVPASAMRSSGGVAICRTLRTEEAPEQGHRAIPKFPGLCSSRELSKSRIVLKRVALSRIANRGSLQECGALGTLSCRLFR